MQEEARLLDANSHGKVYSFQQRPKGVNGNLRSSCCLKCHGVCDWSFLLWRKPDSSNFHQYFRVTPYRKMADNLSVDACLNPEVTNIVEIKLITAQIYWASLPGRITGIPKCIPLRTAKIGKLAPSGQRTCFKDTQKHNFKSTKGC